MSGRKRILIFILAVVIAVGTMLIPGKAFAKTKEGQNTRTVKISDEKVPLGFENLEQLKSYKRAAVVLILAGSALVVITIVASKKEKKDKIKYN
ncbi:MAG: hypothetical protein K6D38_10470 [Pseudobutyrivibrio sp.]|nr:hypothetical protein [Pseudobutyrivibrio sp.]